MHWVIRWADERDRDRSTVVEAETSDAATMVARGLGITPILVARATQWDISDARRSPMRWETIHHAGGGVALTRPGHSAFGRRVGRAQLAALLLAGVATSLLHLRAALPTILS